jgi:RHS repeat-associated protein
MRSNVESRGIEVRQDRTNAPFPGYALHAIPKALLDRSGSSFSTTAWRHYDAWGSLRTGSALGGGSQRYCTNLGHVTDDESGLVYMRARFYEPWTGRFVSEDPAMEEQNWWIYGRSSPTNPKDFIASTSTNDNGLLDLEPLKNMGSESQYNFRPDIMNLGLPEACRVCLTKDRCSEITMTLFEALCLSRSTFHFKLLALTMAFGFALPPYSAHLYKTTEPGCDTIFSTAQVANTTLTAYPLISLAELITADIEAMDHDRCSITFTKAPI